MIATPTTATRTWLSSACSPVHVARIESGCEKQVTCSPVEFQFLELDPALATIPADHTVLCLAYRKAALRLAGRFITGLSVALNHAR